MAPNNTTITLPRPLVNKILRHAQQNPDIEVCGLVGRGNDHQMNYYPIDNVARDPHYHFLMDGPQQIGAIKQMRDKGQTLYAIVHSHPTADAQPSKLDLSENSYPDAFYIIVSLNTKGVLEMRAFKQVENGMQEVELILESDEE